MSGKELDPDQNENARAIPPWAFASNRETRDPTMRKTILNLATAAAIGLLASVSIANAQQNAPFDGKKFFDEIASRGVSMPAGFDGKKFFDDISDRATQNKQFDGKAFFDELSSRGVKLPAGFDGNKFFEEIASRGVSMPPMVVMKK